MEWLARRILLGVTIVILGGGSAFAQGRSATASKSVGYNPYQNPYANPYLNPALTVTNTTRSDALIYLWAAQQQPGGLLVPRPATASAVQPAAEIPASVSQAAGGAGRYFGRGTNQSVPGTGNRYQRFNRYFFSNGR
jgi:hypothetical protein